MTALEASASLHNLAAVYRQQGRADCAAACSTRALEILQEQLERGHPKLEVVRRYARPQDCAAAAAAICSSEVDRVWRCRDLVWQVTTGRAG